MSAAASPVTPRPAASSPPWNPPALVPPALDGARFVLYAVPWEAYASFFDALGERRLRHTYDQGTLELMSPSRAHELVKARLNRLVQTLALELNTPISSAGSTTWRRADLRRGLEGDESYFLAHAEVMRGKLDHDPAVDPPPDLVIEVDFASSSVPRLPVYAALGVPEVWRYSQGRLTFLRRSPEGDYQPMARSLSFPSVGPDDLTPFLDRMLVEDENTLIREFARWAKKRARAEQPPAAASPGKKTRRKKS